METLEQQNVMDRGGGFPHAGEAMQISEMEETEEVIYPESDGEPMGETGYHVRASLDLFGALRQFFINESDVYVSADMFFYYEKGNPRACRAPDVMVTKGVGNHERRIFKLWEERSGPCVIFEITSKSTMIEDMVNKSSLYASLGVREYYLFDPLEEYLDSSLIGFRLEEQQFIGTKTSSQFS